MSQTAPLARPDVELYEAWLAKDILSPHVILARQELRDLLTYLRAVEGELATVKADYETMTRMAGVQPAPSQPDAAAVERVAQAMADAFDCTDLSISHYRQLAEIALRAAREPNLPTRAE